MKLIVVRGALALGTSTAKVWSANPEQLERVAELEAFLTLLETQVWDSATELWQWPNHLVMNHLFFILSK